MNKKWTTYILLGIAIAIILWVITRGQVSAFGPPSGSSSKTPTPYLVPASLPADMTNKGNPTAAGTSTSMSEQNNIIANHSNSTLWNGTIPDFVNYVPQPSPQRDGQPVQYASSQVFGSSY